MIIVAGPPGSGKSTLFSVRSFGVAYFDADDEAAKRNGGSYLRIPQEIRRQVNLEFEAFIHRQISAGVSFALETMLRSGVTFDQARTAKLAGFFTDMRYLALRSFDSHWKRVMLRAKNGGHSAPKSVLRGIYDSSLENLPERSAK